MCSLTFFPLPECSGNGVCSTFTYEQVNKSICICNKGFTSVSDFYLQEGLDCNIHSEAIRILWIIALATCIAYLFVGARVAAFQYSHFRTKLNNPKSKNANDASLCSPYFAGDSRISTFFRNFIKYMNDSARSCQAWTLIQGGLVVIAAIYRLMDPGNNIIGKSVAVSTLTSLYTFAFLMGATDYTRVVFRFVEGYAKNMSKATKDRTVTELSRMQKYLVFLFYLAFPASIAPVLSLRFPNNSFAMAATYHLLLIFWEITLALILLKGMAIMVREIEAHIRSLPKEVLEANDALVMVLNKLKLYSFITKINGPCLFAVWLLLGVSPTFARSTGYFFPILVISSSIQFMMASQSLKNQSKKKTSTTASKVLVTRAADIMTQPNRVASGATLPVSSKGEIADDAIERSPTTLSSRISSKLALPVHENL